MVVLERAILSEHARERQGRRRAASLPDIAPELSLSVVELLHRVSLLEMWSNLGLGPSIFGIMTGRTRVMIIFSFFHCMVEGRRHTSCAALTGCMLACRRFYHRLPEQEVEILNDTTHAQVQHRKSRIMLLWPRYLGPCIKRALTPCLPKIWRFFPRRRLSNILQVLRSPSRPSISVAAQPGPSPLQRHLHRDPSAHSGNSSYQSSRCMSSEPWSPP